MYAHKSTSTRYRIAALQAALGFCLPFSFVARAAEEPVTVTVSAASAGRTPEVIGYNMGDNLPGSNVTSWLRYSELNGARFWWAQEAWPANPAAWPAGENSRARFEADRARLRADPQAGADRAAHAAAIAQTYGGMTPGMVGHCFSLSELHQLGANVLVMLGRSTARHPFDAADGTPDWFGRWTYWRGVYLNAFYLAQHYGVARFQLFNEPDHPNSKHISQPDYLRRLQIGSDAAQAAVADANRLFGGARQVQVSAPVSAGLLVFNARSGRPDTRDVQTGWGELIMRHRTDDFPGRSECAGPLFHTYAFQNYGRDPGRIATGLPELRGLITAANGGAALPILVSEMNVSTAANFSKTADTLDTPSYYAAFGAVAAAYVNAGINEIYVFRLTQNAYEGAGGVKKNGTHFIRQADPQKNILGNTQGAEAVRLLMRGFAGGRVRLATPVVIDSEVYPVAAHDEKTGAYSLMLANLKRARELSLDLSAWELPVGSLVMVDEVSSAHHGDVRSAMALPASGRLVLPMMADSVALVTVWPKNTARFSALACARSADQSWRSAASLPVGGRAVVAIKGNATTAQRVRVYGGAENISQAQLLGQIMLGGRSTETLVDATRYLMATGGAPAVFRLVPDDPRTSREAFVIDTVELRTFAARN